MLNSIGQILDGRTAGVETLGAYLKSKREALNISLQEISQVTRIRRSILEDIENNRYDLLPPKVFAQGFIKSYASYLGLDESEVIKRYSDLVEGPETDGKAVDARASSPPARFSFIMPVAVIGLLLAAAVLWWMNPRHKNAADIVPPPANLTATTIVAIAPPPGEPAERDAGQETAAPAKSAPAGKAEQGSPATAVVEQLQTETAAQQPSAAAAEQPLTETTVEQPAAVTAETPPADAAAPLVLRIVASQDAWMRIQSDKQRPLAFTLNSGQTRTFKAAEKFTIRIGNAGGVDLFLNEQELGKPGKPGEVLELTLPE
jgi:cytoskeleton protein RodZ